MGCNYARNTIIRRIIPTRMPHINGSLEISPLHGALNLIQGFARTIVFPSCTSHSMMDSAVVREANLWWRCHIYNTVWIDRVQQIRAFEGKTELRMRSCYPMGLQFWFRQVSLLTLYISNVAQNRIYVNSGIRVKNTYGY